MNYKNITPKGLVMKFNFIILIDDVKHSFYNGIARTYFRMRSRRISNRYSLNSMRWYDL